MEVGGYPERRTEGPCGWCGTDRVVATVDYRRGRVAGGCKTRYTATAKPSDALGHASVLVQSSATAQRLIYGGDYLRLVGEPSDAGLFLRRGHEALGRADEAVPPTLEGLDVSPGGGAGPHLGVHGRGPEHTSSRRRGWWRRAGRRRGRWPPAPSRLRSPGPRRRGRPSGPARRVPRGPTPPTRSSRCARCPRRRPPGSPPGRSGKRPRVAVTSTSWPASLRRRITPGALYAAMPPVTPTSTLATPVVYPAKIRAWSRP